MEAYPSWQQEKQAHRISYCKRIVCLSATCAKTLFLLDFIFGCPMTYVKPYTPCSYADCTGEPDVSIKSYQAEQDCVQPTLPQLHRLLPVIPTLCSTLSLLLLMVNSMWEMKFTRSPLQMPYKNTGGKPVIYTVAETYSPWETHWLFSITVSKICSSFTPKWAVFTVVICIGQSMTEFKGPFCGGIKSCVTDERESSMV